MLYGHGDDARFQSRPIGDDFSSNIRPDGPPAGLLGHLRTRIDAVAHYPDAGARELAAKLAAINRIAPGQLLVTAGATAGIYLVAQTFRRKRSLIVTPTFSEYEDAARIHEHALDFAPRAELRQTGDGSFAADLVWLCEPNNPSGEILPREQLLALIDARPETVFVIDQSYAGFCAAPQLRASDIAGRENLILLHSFTKILGIPGLRLGAILSSPKLISRIAGGMQPWSVNALALEAGAYYAARAHEFALPLDDLLANTRALSKSISEIPCCAPKPTATNFFLVELAKGNAKALKQHLVKGHGILIRDASNFRGLTPQHIRIATRTPWQNHRLAEALRAWRP
ncbi:threonine-phosphate decarboxylase [Ereboglobus sp. PH5-5]|uniref:aminotransferase class I/II-fold pyridoxal phosphate-dependent enzyme n=1 Tax=unclassified Ereboglobus TaxID=2626932 RepID=UPI002405DD1F|nr:MULTISPECIES: aminotransferase class I/II-fold pyridoxal phosphate-dependent enzyme [unclassified Ereboglobus]MDF9827183.1 threonine-phosphate decarboxylase [Ereboglobus sp. PH5-10]MDF9832604.1 threonine-phosphate decarboxylase [Ereboglobus sp. PH5-5]